MKLKLLISKRFVRRNSVDVEEVFFVVIDSDKKKTYPANFVCMLPKKLDVGYATSSKFSSIYGEESNQIAVKLLTMALKSEDDPDVASEIKKRLKALQPPPKIRTKCLSCGCVFEPKKFGRFLQKTCQSCRTKKQGVC